MKKRLRQDEIKSFVMAHRKTTVRELADHFGISKRTILRDLVDLAEQYDVEACRGVGGGVFWVGDYTPYRNTLTPCEREVLLDLYKESCGERKEILARILHKYGPHNLDL